MYYIVTGGMNSGSALNIAELYDPLTGVWTITTTMNYARALHTQSTLANGTVLVVGGFNGGVYLNSAELYYL